MKWNKLSAEVTQHNGVIIFVCEDVLSVMLLLPNATAIVNKKGKGPVMRGCKGDQVPFFLTTNVFYIGCNMGLIVTVIYL